jgi:hypothetical protein
MSIEDEHYKEEYGKYQFALESYNDEEIMMLALGTLVRLHSVHPLLKAIADKLQSQVMSTPEGVREVIKNVEVLGINLNRDKNEAKS